MTLRCQPRTLTVCLLLTTLLACGLKTARVLGWQRRVTSTVAVAGV